MCADLTLFLYVDACCNTGHPTNDLPGGKPCSSPSCFLREFPLLGANGMTESILSTGMISPADEDKYLAQAAPPLLELGRLRVAFSWPASAGNPGYLQGPLLLKVGCWSPRWATPEDRREEAESPPVASRFSHSPLKLNFIFEL